MKFQNNTPLLWRLNGKTQNIFSKNFQINTPNAYALQDAVLNFEISDLR
jgi:hypothetical protein